MLAREVLADSFWASWCTPCRKELPVLAAIQKKATREKIVVFAVNWRESEIPRFVDEINALWLNSAQDETERPHG
jgi:thiol-disulfide isomerase/thioredoxin